MIKKIIQFILVGFLFVSCEQLLFERDPENTPVKNFESMWSAIDKKYSFFDFKDIDWNNIYTIYRPQVTNDMSDEELFDLLFDMLNQLRDAHVNLWAPFDVSRYENVFLDSPPNFDRAILDRYYLKQDYRQTGTLINKAFGKVGYIYYGSFAYGISESDLDYILHRFQNLEGLIVDVRNNGGGNPDNAFRMASRFTTAERHVYDTYLKTGPGHNDFSGPNPVYIEPNGEYKFTKKIILLTNRSSYSATNLFTAMMKALPNVTIMGDTTGGGGGAPIGYELPNGWYYRFSATQITLPDGFMIEDGIPPDKVVYMRPVDEARGVDRILETALAEF